LWAEVRDPVTGDQLAVWLGGSPGNGRSASRFIFETG